MRKTIILFVFSLFAVASYSQDAQRYRVLMETNAGNITLELYDETPLHRDNFVKLVKNGFYDGVLFHRVIKDFMIQGGDPDSRNAVAGQELGNGEEKYRIPAEICFPKIYHKRGALAAAREPDYANPQRESSACQFYIVYGQVFNDPMLERVQQRISQNTDGTVVLTDEQREVYKTVGGTPHLDGQYTVFGEVVEGMDVVEKIQAVATDSNDRPLDDVRIIRATVVAGK